MIIERTKFEMWTIDRSPMEKEREKERKRERENERERNS